MPKSNCRDIKICGVCQYWLGKEPTVNYRNGDMKYSLSRGQCSLDDSGKQYSINGLCNRFKKDIRYM